MRFEQLIQSRVAQHDLRIAVADRHAGRRQGGTGRRRIVDGSCRQDRIRCGLLLGRICELVVPLPIRVQLMAATATIDAAPATSFQRKTGSLAASALGWTRRATGAATGVREGIATTGSAASRCWKRARNAELLLHGAWAPERRTSPTTW